ncbi:UNVERIFIED_CONTAM: hypothetical protein FKN15_057213 [Acipenser sinensis]
MALIFQAWGQGSSAAPLCSKYQEGFEDSCYEFVGFQRSFHSAQGWCERGGGHLAFILNDETQQFLQKHLQPDRDWWIGLAPATENLTRESAAAEAWDYDVSIVCECVCEILGGACIEPLAFTGPLSWLDGSDVSYANWKTDAPAAVQCGHILKDSGYQWEATSNCSQELYFVCEFESGRSLACVEYNATLQCGSGQVIQIDDSFYGRKTLHYCRQPISPPSPGPEEECSWVDVADLVAGHCHGLQVCQAVADVASFGEPCPGLGSYLSVEYHCKEGLQLLVGELVPVFENVTITLRWLLFPFTGNLTCSLSAGDGRIIDPYSPAQSNSSVVHRYTRASVFTVSVECTTSEWHVAAQKTISVLEPISEFGTIRCYSKKQWRDSLNCSVLYGSTLQIQVELEAGTNVTYTVLSGNALLAKSTVLRGIMPHNLTIDTTTQQQMGPGSHPLTILASNNVTAPDVTVELEVLFVEPVQGLQAMLTTRDDIVLGNDLQISVSISHGAPVELVFQFVGLSNYTRKKELKDSQAKVFSFRTNFEGTFHVTVSASNGFSEMSLAIGSQTVIPNPSSASNVTEEPDSDTESGKYCASDWVMEQSKDEHDSRDDYYTRCKSLYGEKNKDVKVHISSSNWYKPVSLKASCEGSCSKIDWYYVNHDNEVGPLTTYNVTQCLCNHLTSFGSSFFVMPNAVDVSRSAELFASFSSNPVVVCTVASLIGVYILVIIWARRKDIKDADKVTVTLNGSEGESDPHHLTDPLKPVFERGETDMFLLTTPFSLGELQSLRLWHDNTGSHPAWYVNRVLVHDLETDQTWQFLCNSWLAIDVGECVLDKVFPVATEADLKQFSNLFFMKTTKDFRDGHLWFSVLSRPPSSNFTCVQRVSCCFSLLLCTMLTSIIFYGVPTDPSEQKMDLGGFTITWHQVMIGFESSILVFPINLLIVTIFRKVRPREKKDQKKEDKQQDKTEHGKTVRVSPSQPPSPQSVPRELTPESVIKDIKRLAQSLSKAMKSPLPLLDKDFGRTTDINQLLSMVEEIIHQQNRAGEEFYNESHKKDSSMALTLGAVDLQESSPAENQAKTPGEAQRRNDYNQYLYRQLEHVERELELLGPKRFSTPQSYSQAVQQVQGMKGLLERQLSSSATDRLSQCPGPTDADVQKKGCQKGLPWWFVFLGWLLVLASSSVSAYFTMLYGLHYGKQGSINWLISMSVSFFESLFLTQPLKVLGLALFFALVLKRVDPEEESEGPIDRMLTSSAYIGFLWMLLLVAYGQRDPNGYFLTSHIRQSFTSDLSDSMKHGDFFNWANSTLLSNLYGPYPGFITDGNSKLVGSARMRQVRVQKDSCPVTRLMRSTVRDCHAPYSWDLEDMDSYGPGWNISAPRNTSQFSSVWKYQSQGSLRAHPLWGNIALYRGGGYVAVLGTDIENATSVLQYLIDNTWLDEYTRAIFVEFTVYNANLNLFCIVNVMLETSAVGAFQPHAELHNVRLYQGTGGLQYFVMGSEIIYFLFIIYYMVLQGRLMKEQRWAYFKSKCNLLDLAIIVLSWSALCMFINRTILGNRDVEYYQNHRDQFASFYETATADSALGYIIAFLVLLATVKMWHLMRLNPKLNMITATLRRAWTDISGFINVIVIMLLSYSIATNLMFGWKLYSYRSLQEAALTMVSLQLGFFNYQEVLDYNPVLGAFMIGSCIIFMSFVVLNLFISVILVAFSEEQQQHQPSEEEEIVDMMIEKLCSLFGIKLKKRESSTKDSLKKQTSHPNETLHTTETSPTL